MTRIRYFHTVFHALVVRIATLLLCVVLWQPYSAQKGEYGLSSYREITTAEGLPSNNITSFVQDKQGFMWLGTSNGLARFDGSDVRVFKHSSTDSNSLSSNRIKCLALDSSGYLWIGTADEGLDRYDPRTNTFTNYCFNASDTTSLGNNNIHCLTVDRRGTLWVGQYGNGLSIYRPASNTFERIVPPSLNSSYRDRQTQIINDILPDLNDTSIYWFTTYDGLWQYNRATNSFRIFDDISHLQMKGEPLMRSFRHGTQAHDGKLYITAFRRGVFCFDPATEVWTHFTERNFDPKRLHHNNFQHIQQRDSTTFWVGSNTRGICLLDLKTGFVELLGNCDNDEPGDLCDIFVNAMHMNHNGAHWIATNAGFRFYLKRYNNIQIHHADARASHLKGRFYVQTLHPHNNHSIYFAGYAGDGVYKFDTKSRLTTFIEPPPGFRVNEKREMFWVQQIAPFRDGKLLVISAHHIFTLDTLTDKLHHVQTDADAEDSQKYFNQIIKHSNGNYYLTTRHNGVMVLDSNLQKIDELLHNAENENSLVSSNYVFGSCEDPLGNIWIGTEEGFSVYNPDKNTFDNFDYHSRADSVPMLKGIYGIRLAPDSSLWFIDANSSVAVINYPYQKPYKFTIYNSGDGLAYDKINNLLFDSLGNAWVSNGDVISLLRSDGQIFNLSPRHNIPAMRSLAPMTFLSDKQLMLGAENSLVWFNTQTLADTVFNAPLYIESFKIYGKEYLSSQCYRDVKNIVLNYNENFFSLNIGMINFSHTDELSTWYRLKGFNNEWTQTGNERTAIFTNVPGGEYVFEARTLGLNGQIASETLTLKIRVIPPFWKTWWFTLLVICFALGLFFSFYYLRINAIKREARMKTEFNKRIANVELTALRAQMNPHFLFNSLNSIRLHIINNSVEKADSYLVKFSRLVRLVLQNSRSQLIPLADELEALQLYLDLESGRFDSKFTSLLTVSPEVPVQKLVIPPMIIQPYVENAIWHGLMQKDAPGRVQISLSVEEDRLKIQIEDDGIGREKAREIKSKSALKRESMGMEITGNRLEIIEKIYTIRCDVFVTDLKNEYGEASGTRVIINLPVIYGP